MDGKVKVGQILKFIQETVMHRAGSAMWRKKNMKV